MPIAGPMARDWQCHAGNDGDRDACRLIAKDAIFYRKLQIPAPRLPVTAIVRVGSRQAEGQLEVRGRTIMDFGAS